MAGVTECLRLEETNKKRPALLRLAGAICCHKLMPEEKIRGEKESSYGAKMETLGGIFEGE